MKFFIASDIHGSAYYCRMMLEAFEREKADRIILLGDILYHGPRNDLPREYAPKSMISMLNPLRNRIFCVRGNCDTEVDQMVLDFPLLADYGVLESGGRIIYATHGHIYNEDRLPPLCSGDVLLHGHTHIPVCTEHKSYVCINPGSVSIPKQDSPHSYITLEDGIFIWKNLENGETYKTYSL